MAKVEEVALSELQVGDVVIVYPHEICPVDGVIIEGHGYVDESYLVDLLTSPKFRSDEVLSLTASLERYSKHPRASAMLKASAQKSLAPLEATEVHEVPGQGLLGTVSSRKIQVTNRKTFALQSPDEEKKTPPLQDGLECLVAVDGRFAGILRFHDAPRKESKSFVSHLGSQHSFDKILILSGDRKSEVNYLANQVGIKDVYFQKCLEEKLSIVREETKKTKTLYVGDGINDTPAMIAATA